MEGPNVKAHGDWSEAVSPRHRRNGAQGVEFAGDSVKEVCYSDVGSPDKKQLLFAASGTLQLLGRK